jgi:hypothetical protein
LLIGAAAILTAGIQFLPGSERSGPVLTKAVEFVSPKPSAVESGSSISDLVMEASSALRGSVRSLSDANALTTAFRAYFTYKAEHPRDVKKPLLYFVDYGLPSTTPRGYVFDMKQLRVVDGPFMVAHGRGSSRGRIGAPTRFSNAPGSEATSLGLYLTSSTYAFHGKSGGRRYTSVGLRLRGVSEGFNDNALARGVVAHGAPYVTPKVAGRSEGCPAMEQSRAQALLPQLANGAMVFLFAPDQSWLTTDRWVTASLD